MMACGGLISPQHNNQPVLGGARGPQPPGECGDATERLVAVVVDVEDDVVVVVVVVVDVVVGRCCRCCCCCGDA